jgi:hypothetical protein
LTELLPMGDLRHELAGLGRLTSQSPSKGSRTTCCAIYHCLRSGLRGPGGSRHLPAPGRGLRTTSESTPPGTMPPVPPGPLRTSEPDGELTRERRAAGDIGGPCAELVLLCVHVREAALFAPLYTAFVTLGDD